MHIIIIIFPSQMPVCSNLKLFYERKKISHFLWMFSVVYKKNVSLEIEIK